MLPEELDALMVVLGRSQERGFIGPGALGPHVQRALDLLPLMPSLCHTAVDLGSGGGLPGLPLALETPQTKWLLLDGSTSRISFLAEAVETLGVDGRVRPLAARAEEAGRHPDLRGRYDLVVSRSFGPPATTAECAAPLLRPGGLLIVAEPPGGRPGRWDPDGLSRLGMRPIESVTDPSAFQIIEQTSPCPDSYPRRNGVPAKRLLF